MLVNEYDPKKGFYKLFNAEEKIRLMASLCKNSYMITIFACCRQLYDEKKMQGYFSKTQIAEEKKINLLEDSEEQELDLEYNQITVDSELKKRGSVPHNLEDGKTSRLNFIFIWGCRPSSGVDAETAMVSELA